MTTTAQILDEAGQILANPSAWTQGSYCNGHGINGNAWERSTAYCAVGAIREAYRRNEMGEEFASANTPAVHALGHAILQAGFRDFHHPAPTATQWNDEPLRTHPEVVEMFEKARAYAAEQAP